MTAAGFNGAGSRGFWFHDAASISEGSYVQVNADQNTVGYDFDTSGQDGGSFDYSEFFLHLVASTVGGTNATGMRVIAGQQLFGCRLHLAGNALASVGLTTTVLQVGGSASDTSRLQACELHVNVEADAGAGTVRDMVVQGGANSGIINCTGNMTFLSTGKSFTAGSVTAPAVVKCAGYLLGPLFASHGTKTPLGHGGTLSTYSNKLT